MRNRRGVLWLTWAVIILAVAAVWMPGAAAQTTEERAAGGGKVRTYYIAADEVDWNYAPTGIDQMTGKPFEADSLRE